MHHNAHISIRSSRRASRVKDQSMVLMIESSSREKCEFVAQMWRKACDPSITHVGTALIFLLKTRPAGVRPSFATKRRLAPLAARGQRALLSMSPKEPPSLDPTSTNVGYRPSCRSAEETDKESAISLSSLRPAEKRPLRYRQRRCREERGNKRCAAL